MEEEKIENFQVVVENRDIEQIGQNNVEYVIPQNFSLDGEETFIIETDNVSAEETNLKPHIVRSSNYGGPNSRKSSTLKSGRKRALAGEGWGPLQGPKVLLTEDKVRLGHNPLQVYTHLATSQKNYANNVKEINSFLNENQGSFSAFSGTYYTNSRVTNEKGLYVLSGDGSERQFRMKLPSTNICAFLAVGIRHTQEGSHNIACTLASTDSEWSTDRTFANLIEATKRIGGLSFGDILKHPRCADPISVKERFSKAAVNTMKTALSGIPDDEKKAMSKKALADLKVASVQL